MPSLRYRSAAIRDGGATVGRVSAILTGHVQTCAGETGRGGEAAMMIGQLRRRLRQQSNARRRRLDTEVLWPQVLHQASGDVRAARNAFHLHISLDPAWRDLDEAERDCIIDRLH
jgi:hypothetical protein